MMARGDTVLRAEGIVKTFPGVRALDGAGLDLRAGEIHALMGENGAGKSTLIKVLTGVHERDAGTVTLRGEAVSPASPKDAEALGISTVYQEVNLIPDLSVAENIMLGRQPRRGPFIRWGEVRRLAEAAVGRVGLGAIDVRRPAGSYSLAVQQMVAIARALDVEAGVLILDEPTSSLDEAEVAQLFAVMRRLREEGLALLFVTHFLEQVYAVCDRITVLRNGRPAGEFATADLPRLALVETMLGRQVSGGGAGEAEGREAVRAGAGDDVFLRARGLVRRGAVGPVDLALRRGEAHGLAGLLGSGRTETARLLFGADRPTSGTLEMAGGRPVALRSPRHAIAAGIGFSSEDRKAEGIVPTLSVRENLVLAMQASRGILRRIPAAEQDAVAERFIGRFAIRTPSPEAPIGTLSGGNQQKVLLARWLCLQPELLILDEPTRGIDVGTKAEIEKLVGELCDGGMAVLFISSELEEIARTCARVSVMRDRAKVAELEGEAVGVETIMHAIAAPSDGGDDAEAHGEGGP